MLARDGVLTIKHTPAAPTMKARRQSNILEIVERESVRSQEQLRQRLRTAGFDVTQATLSRDIRELGLVKGGAEGAYRAAPRERGNGHAATSLLHRALSEYLTRIDRVQQLVLLRTGPGQAPLLGVAIDAARFPEVVGTLAGDDTILAVTPDARRARALVKRLDALTQGPAGDRQAGGRGH
jgi:transcriptional regulator of arginine metabolism